MTVEPRIIKVPQGQIDFQDDTFQLSPELHPKLNNTTRESIKRVGILTPPILKELEPRFFQIVTGYKRLDFVFHELGNHACWCLALPAETPVDVTLTYALEAICQHRQPTPVEKAHFFNKILVSIDEKEAAHRFLPYFSLRPNPAHIHAALKLLQLEEPLLMALHAGFLDENTANFLAGLPFTDRMALFELIDYLNLSISNQRKLVQTCNELAKRANSSILSVLSTTDIKEIISHTQANPPQKTAKLMMHLQELQLPRLSQSEREFRQFAHSMNLNKGVTVQHSPAFEKDEVTISIQLPDRDKLTNFWPALKDLLASLQ